MSDEQRFADAIAAIDQANAEDPNRLVVNGVSRPKEVVHAEMMSDWVKRLDPDASPAQLLAARAHHLRRWVVPRDHYPAGRAGYLRWRTDQKKRHATEVAEMLTGVGYDADTIERVGQIIRKEKLRSDPAVQVHEDALCLVFLETQFDSTTELLGEQHMVEVLAKTLPKMSEQGVAAALQLPLSPAQVALVHQAIDHLGRAESSP